ncbi:MAG: Nif3-like dinuclear metal center hexameric protein [Bacteroides sp.]|nr:Nif3-like dinuclear metal center hexameric protein [Roseburia sp.]MCM1345940.1 Nif3-like dinuclear metal center hexameric protein [Bacteroides sp.]MCM1420304.1 Nif3-like dinuclear metal center hexameric protein [Bacteroides sp.]
MKIREILEALEVFAPLSLQDGYDNAGLQIGLTEDAEATGALLCLDVTEAVIDEAVSRQCNVIVSHHPLLFRPCKNITSADYVGRCIFKAIKNGMAIYAAHTNLDNAFGGVNWKIAEKIGLDNVRALAPKSGMEGVGAGILGTFSEPMRKDCFVAMIKDIFHVDCVRCNDWTGESVRTVAVCGGAGAFLLPNAAAAGADVFITGEIGYHRFFGYENSMLLMEIGHFESEQYTLEVLDGIIHRAVPELPVFHTAVRTNPISYICD